MTLTPPSLNLTPAERPNLPRSQTDQTETTTGHSSFFYLTLTPPHLIRRTLSSLFTINTSSTRSTNNEYTTNNNTDLTSCPTLTPRLLSVSTKNNHHRSLSSDSPSLQPTLVQISSPSSSTNTTIVSISRSNHLNAHSLLKKTLNHDAFIRSSYYNSPIPSIPPSSDSSSSSSSSIVVNHHQHSDPSNSNSNHLKNPLPLDPVLADLEAKSRFNVQTECAICQKKGINFPKCPKCQLEFCSRTCRVSMGDGERHKCP